ncbi:MAG: MBL fold metallo-hydrolase [Methanotrichaceae archaeon]|jgi:ribonuclease Z
MSTKVTLLGTGVGIPQPGRSQAAILVETERPLLLDCGAGTLLRLDEAGIDVENLDTVLLTHLHLDHVSDLLALANVRYLRRLPGLEVYGPVGTATWLETLHSAFPYLEKMQVTVHEVRPMDDFSVLGFDIFAEEAKHSVAALAYRIEAEEKVLVYSGDTEPSPRVAALAEGADLLIHECSFPEPFDVTNHTTPKKLGRLLKNVNRVVLTHFYPQALGCEEDMALEVSELSGAPVLAGWDMMTMIL